ncbi:glycosyltransferase family 2 protein [Methanobrevibacter arboriphilus]|uniref:glycosyltransferase family 2 protein n=1 Tax=Methanobrevibacter arboriphilus TaxID=39441 RepID=UPI0006D04525|nr:glycosyltransferase family 2 protein [Methanobrevibacter arboriphilus]
MVDNIKISVIVPVYNVEKYLSNCLDSIINQSLEDIEIICVNDGSTDNSLKILEEYAANDNRIRIITKKNEGLGAARKTGLDNSSGGEYILFVDSDDYIKNDACEKVYGNALSNDSELVFFNFCDFNENRVFDPCISCNAFNSLKNSENFNNLTFKAYEIKECVLNSYFSAWSKLYKKSFLYKYDDFYFPKHRIFEDLFFHVQVIIRAERISYCNEGLYLYRRSNSNSIMNNTREKVFDVFIAINLIKEFLIKNDLFNYYDYEFLLFYLHLFNSWFYKINEEYKQKFFEKFKRGLLDIHLKKRKN